MGIGDITWCFICAIALLVGYLCGDHVNCFYLAMAGKSKHKTPVKLRGEFFYIVPESEWVETRRRAYYGHDI